MEQEEKFEQPTQPRRMKILLVEDDEDDSLIFRDLISEIPQWQIELEVAATYDEALRKKDEDQYDVCFLDYQLGRGNGIQLLREFISDGFCAPIILLTGRGAHEVDVQATEEGASDYLEKSIIDSNLLERSIRYAVSRASALEALRRSESRIREMSTKLIDAQERERKAIFRELHDSIGGSLTAVKFKLDEALEDLEGESVPGKTAVEQAFHMLKETIQETRRISSNLRPPMLEHKGLLPAIQGLCSDYQKYYPGIQLDPTLDIREQDVPEKTKTVVFRILQEALNNIAKHSDADSVRVELALKHDHIRLTIRDNGQGFDLKETTGRDRRTGGFGLSSMKERAELQGGSLTVLTSKGRGTTIRAYWPCGG